MDLGDGLSETVQFDIPDLAGAARVARRLRPYWTVSVQERNEVALVSAGLLAETDVAQLLRAAEAWVAEESLRAIRFELDGRCYVLEAGEADWTAAA